MSSQRLSDYLALGDSGDRPLSLDLPSACVGFRWETDTGAWIWDGSAWIQITGTSGIGVAGSDGDIQINYYGAFGAITPGYGVVNFLETPSSANLRAALTDEVGTGAAYFVGGGLGTPASGDASNLTSIPVANATGILGKTHGGAGDVNGILKANGSGTVSAAAAGTDYAAAPGGSANTPLFDGGSGGFINGTRTGNTTEVVTGTGSYTPGNLLVSDASGNAIDGGPVPAAGAGGVGDVSGGSTSTDGELAAYNGTGGKTLKQSFSKFSGPASTVKTFTLPNASATILTDNAVVTVAQGGTNATSASGTALDNITGFSSTGILARTGSGAYSFRTVTGTSNRISITNGIGVSGNPTIDIDSAYVGQNTITTLGTIGTGTWQGSVIGSAYGGAGDVNGILKANGSGTVSQATAGTDYATVAQAKDETLIIAISDESTAITTGTKVTFRMPWAATLNGVRSSLVTASTASGPFQVDIKESGTTVFSTKLTIDDNEKTSTTAATAAVISDSALADDAEMSIIVDVSGTGAKGGKIYLLLTRA